MRVQIFIWFQSFLLFTIPHFQTFSDFFRLFLTDALTPLSSVNALYWCGKCQLKTTPKELLPYCLSTNHYGVGALSIKHVREKNDQCSTIKAILSEAYKCSWRGGYRAWGPTFLLVIWKRVFFFFVGGGGGGGGVGRGVACHLQSGGTFSCGQKALSLAEFLAAWLYLVPGMVVIRHLLLWYLWKQRVRVRVMIGFLVRGRIRIKIRIRVRVGVMFNVSVYHGSNCRRSKMSYIQYGIFRN